MPNHIRLAGDWLVFPIMPGRDFSPDGRPPAGYHRVPENAHLQPVLYPDNPYWGSHVRRINDSDWIYQRTFTVPDTAARRIRLRFEGVDYFASVWVNGQFVGDHEGHFAPFDFDVTAFARRGAENTLTVRVSSPWDVPIPGKTSPTDRIKRNLVKGLYEHGEGLIPPDVNPIGVWRPVWLLLDDGFSIDQVRIRADLDGTVNLRLRLTNATGQAATYKLGLSAAEIGAGSHDADPHDAGGHKCAPLQTDTMPVNIPPGTHDFTHTLHIPDAKWWWCWDHGDANLYALVARLCDESGHVLDERAETFGFRTIELLRSPDRFAYILNGREIYVRGTSYLPDIYLSRCSRGKIERDMAFVREAHLNLVRVHVHVSPPEVYDWCDRNGMLVWQDFELNWIHEDTPEFEARARRLQAEMIDLLGNHPSIMTWACHNEPTMIFVNRQNLERRPDPALYADAVKQDPTRPVFICSGQMESDWQRSGDSHPYFGSIWSKRYTDVYRRRYKLVSEFGVEIPAAAETLRQHPEVWERLGHLESQIDTLWAYQAELTKFHIEHFRCLRAEGNAGYIHFWLSDLVPQVGCGVLDSCRRPKGGYAALRQASAPLHIAMQHDGRRAYALWVFNDRMESFEGAVVSWRVYRTAAIHALNAVDVGEGLRPSPTKPAAGTEFVATAPIPPAQTQDDPPPQVGKSPLQSLERGFRGEVIYEAFTTFNIRPNAAQRVMPVDWSGGHLTIELTLHTADGDLLASNVYPNPFNPKTRPEGYPWKFDHFLGCKVYNRPGATSLIQLDGSSAGVIPVVIAEKLAEWGLRQQFPPWLVSAIARLVDR